MANKTIYEKPYLLKGIINGVLCALGINIWVVLSFYVNFNNLHLFILGIPLAAISYFLLKNERIKYFFSAWGLSILAYIVVKLLLSATGVVYYFYSQAVGDGIRMTAGDGFGIMVIHLFNYLWLALAIILAFIASYYTQSKNNITR